MPYFIHAYSWLEIQGFNMESLTQKIHTKWIKIRQLDQIIN